MNQDPQNLSLTQISYLVNNLTKKNFAQNCQIISQIVETFGLESDRHYLRCLFSTVNFLEPTSSPLHCKLLGEELNAQLTKPAFISNICFAVDNHFLNQKFFKISTSLIPQICKATSTATQTSNKLLEIVISLALTHSQNQELRKFASDHLKRYLPVLIDSYIDSYEINSERNLNDISPDLLQLILTLLCQQTGTTAEIYKKFIEKLRKEFPRQRAPLILVPYLYKNFEDQKDSEREEDLNSNELQQLQVSEIMDTSWVNLVLEIGYEFTSNLEDCKSHLRQKCGREIQAQDVAKIIGLMCRTHTSLSDCNVNLPTPTSFWPGQQDGNANSDKKDQKPPGSETTQTWKPDVFVQALKEIVPQLNWKEVCIGFDHHEFAIKDRLGLTLLLTIVRLGTQANGTNFPAECLYGHWQNVDGQFSLIATILKNPDLFSFADYIFTSVPVELLKTPPETDNKEIATWKSLHLVEVLLYIADHGYYPQAYEIFKFPAQHCPDILFMALLQISPPLSVIRQDLFSNLIPTFLGNHPNSGVIFHHAWNSQNFSHTLRPIIMHSMSEWYLRGELDQTKLTRILDVAQDLKALSSLLNARSFSFVIDLACLASRRAYLKLEKWVNDKIREHGEPFVQALIKFLQRRCPQIAGDGKMAAEDQMPKVAQLPQESISVILTCLQNCAGSVSNELWEVIMQMSTNCTILMSKARQGGPPILPQQGPPQVPQPPGVLRQHRGLDPSPFSNNINVAQQMFGSGPTAIDALAGLNSNMAGLNLSGGPNGASLTFGNVLSNLISTPASPSRLLSGGPPPSNSPFPMMSLPGGPTNLTNLARIQPTPPTVGGDKMHLPATPSNIPDLAQTVSKEVEDEANSYFQRIYNHPPHPTLSIDEVLDMLQRFKDSQIRREQEVYQCMLRNLFEEYRFFPQYPDKELQITAQLFGGIIERNLVPTFVALGLALRCVLDALRKPESSKMYYFGITALDRFKIRLHQYNKYCEYVRSIPHFQDFPPHLIQYVEYGYQSMEPPNKPQGPVLPASMAHMIPSGTTSAGLPQQQQPESLYRSSSVTGNIVTTPTPKIASQPIHPSRVKSIATATNIDTLLSAQDREEKITVPPDNIQDKTAFIFNNLSQLNLQQKCDEIKDIMTKEFWPWLSQYMVLKRASIELNFHSLYSNFLDALKNNEILRLVTRETFRNIRVLLRSDKGIANFSDRSLLKNLGHWLGMMTLGRNRPILLIDLDLKSLLVEAYHKGQQELLYVVPFVAKVLESCSKSKVFKPPNPWTMAIMNVLAELHTEQDLKLNLKFEIEVLCKTLSIDISELKPVIYLKDAERAMSIEYQLSQPKPKEPQDELSAASPVTSTDASGQVVVQTPEPRFNYTDVNISNTNMISQHVILSSNFPMLHANPQLKVAALSAIEKSITEWLPLVVERSVRIGVSTSEQIVRKDFALDPDEQRMRTAAHYMVRNLSAGMAMLTCRDQLPQTMTAYLKKAFEAHLNTQTLEIAQAAAQITTDNVELACAFIQKAACEKAIPEIDRRLAADFEVRKLAREEGRRFCDADILSYQSERMPEPVRLKVGGVPTQQFAVYEEFARNIPGFQIMSERDAAMLLPKTAPIPEPMPNFPTNAVAAVAAAAVSNNTTTIAATDELGIMYADLATKMESFLNSAANNIALQLQASKMHGLLNVLMAARRHRDTTENAQNLLKGAVDCLIEGLVVQHPSAEHIDQMKLYRDINLRILTLLHSAFGSTQIERAITACIFELREEVRYNVEAIKLLITSRFINIQQFDVILSQKMDNGNNYLAVNFAMQLIQHFLIDDRSLVSESEFYNTIDLLARLSAHHRGPEGLQHLIELLRINHDSNSFNSERNLTTTPSQFIESGILHVRANDGDDPPGLHDKTEFLLKDWVHIHYNNQHGRDPVKTFGVFVNKMNLYGILKTDDLITRFFRQATQICINYVYQHISDQPNALNKAKIFQFIDAFVRLIALLVRHSGDTGNPSTKINLLNKVLGIVLAVLLQDQDVHGTTFQQLGYHRFFIMLFLELSSPDPVLENLMHSIVTAFCHTYHILNPAAAPGFCYSWLELISHRVFLGRILAQIPQQKGWPLYSQLLMDLFKYLAPFLRNAELAKPVQLLYKGTLRVLLVLLHDFPEFLCDYHFGFCDVIPSNCIQMRNIILAAFPRNMRLPDPFTPNLKVDMLPETATAPRIYTNYVVNIQPPNFKKDLDSYLKARAPVTFLSELRSHLQISKEPGSRYNIPLMNALVLYVGNQAIAHIRSKNLMPSSSTIDCMAHMDIFQNLAVDLDNEGRYLFLNAIANQLRYPNSHTHYFSCAILHLFVEANSEAIQEQITRVLLERLIVNRPHPWGLLITFIELIKNPLYKFWEHDFVHCAPEIEKLFDSVARSCMVKSNHQQQQITNNTGTTNNTTAVEPNELQECN